MFAGMSGWGGTVVIMRGCTESNCVVRIVTMMIGVS